MPIFEQDAFVKTGSVLERQARETVPGMAHFA
jgi:hypothetical protein